MRLIFVWTIPLTPVNSQYWTSSTGFRSCQSKSSLRGDVHRWSVLCTPRAQWTGRVNGPGKGSTEKGCIYVQMREGASWHLEHQRPIWCTYHSVIWRNGTTGDVWTCKISLCVWEVVLLYSQISLAHLCLNSKPTHTEWLYQHYFFYIPVKKESPVLQ